MKKTLIIISIVILVLFFSGFFLIRGTNSGKNVKEPEVTIEPTVILPTISEDIKVDLSGKNSNRIVILKISGLSDDLLSIEYELTYTTGAGLVKGALGKIVLKGEKEIIRDDIVLGTCSSGRCVYDEGVDSITLSLKFNSQKGSSVFQKTFSL